MLVYVPDNPPEIIFSNRSEDDLFELTKHLLEEDSIMVGDWKVEKKVTRIDGFGFDYSEKGGLTVASCFLAIPLTKELYNAYPEMFPDADKCVGKELLTISFCNGIGAAPDKDEAIEDVMNTALALAEGYTVCVKVHKLNEIARGKHKNEIDPYIGSGSFIIPK